MHDTICIWERTIFTTLRNLLPFNGFGQRRDVQPVQQQVVPPQQHVPPPMPVRQQVVLGPWDQQVTLSNLWAERDVRSIFQLKVKTLFQNGLFEYDRAFDVWEDKFSILIVELKKAYALFNVTIEKQTKRDARAKKIALQIGFTVLTIGLSAVGLGFAGELIRHAITSEGASLVASCVQETIVELGKEVTKKIVEGISETIEHNLINYSNGKAAKGLKTNVNRLNNLDEELDRLHDALRDVIREMKLKYALLVRQQTTDIADNPNRLRQVFSQLVRLIAIRHGRPYQVESQTTCSKNEFHDEMDAWVSRTRRDLDRELTRLFHCPHDQARNNRVATKDSLEKMLWAEWIVAQAEGKTQVPRANIVHFLSSIGGNDVYKSSNFRVALGNGKDASVLQDVGSDITDELVRLGVVEWRDKRYGWGQSDSEKQRLDQEFQQNDKVFTGRSIRGQIGGDRAKGRLVLWAHTYLDGNPLKEALGVQTTALQNAGVLGTL